MRGQEVNFVRHTPPKCVNQMQITLRKAEQWVAQDIFHTVGVCSLSQKVHPQKSGEIIFRRFSKTY